jgi:hypothetical protein
LSAVQVKSVISAKSFGATQRTRERTSGEPKHVFRGGIPLRGAALLASGSRRRRKSASTLSGILVPTRPEFAGPGAVAQERRPQDEAAILRGQTIQQSRTPGVSALWLCARTRGFPERKAHRSSWTPRLRSLPACLSISSPSPVSWPLNWRAWLADQLRRSHVAPPAPHGVKPAEALIALG